MRFKVSRNGWLPDLPDHRARLCAALVKQRFIVHNSRGAGRGMKGYFTLPYADVTDASLVSDFWTVRIVQ